MAALGLVFHFALFTAEVICLAVFLDAILEGVGALFQGVQRVEGGGQFWRDHFVLIVRVRIIVSKVSVSKGFLCSSVSKGGVYIS